jgi:hypothetical protein
MGLLWNVIFCFLSLFVVLRFYLFATWFWFLKQNKQTSVLALHCRLETARFLDEYAIGVPSKLARYQLAVDWSIRILVISLSPLTDDDDEDANEDCLYLSTRVAFLHERPPCVWNCTEVSTQLEHSRMSRLFHEWTRIFVFTLNSLDAGGHDGPQRRLPFQPVG